MNASIKKCSIKDLEALLSLSIETFDETFSPLNTQAAMTGYMEKAFTREKLTSELENPDSEFYFLYDGDRLAGYLKLNETSAQTELNAPEALEIERIYVSSEFQRRGFGRLLLDYALSRARTRGKEYVFLGVWEYNEKALNFYKKNGFYRIGEHTFVMGEEAQTDYLMRKDLN